MSVFCSQLKSFREFYELKYKICPLEKTLWEMIEPVERRMRAVEEFVKDVTDVRLFFIFVCSQLCVTTKKETRSSS